MSVSCRVPAVNHCPVPAAVLPRPSSHARRCPRLGHVQENVAVPGVQELSLCGGDRHTNSQSIVRSGVTKGSTQRRGSQKDFWRR